MIQKKNHIQLDFKDVQILLMILQGYRLTDIADFLGIRQPSLTERLRDLETVGFLTSQPSTGAKHVKIVYALTEQAREVVTTMSITIPLRSSLSDTVACE